MSPPAVSISDVAKKFRLYHERPTTLKERAVAFRRSRYEVFWALDGVSLDIAEGQTAALIGPNGSGKSTLLKLIAGIMWPDKGRIETRGRIASLLELGAGFHPDLTGRENIYMNASILGLTRKETDRFFDAIVAFAELDQFIDLQIRHYSSGMYVRLGFAVAVHVDPDILLVDEVLSVGDEAFQRKCLDRIRQFQKDGRSIVFVTHAVDTARTLTNDFFFLNHGRLEAAGEADEVVRKFRLALYGQVEELHETKEVKIESVELLDSEGIAKQEYRAGQPMQIRITLASNRPVEDPVVTLALYDERNNLLFRTNTARKSVRLGVVDGKMQIEFRIDSVPVLDEGVLVTVGVHSRDDLVVYDWLPKKHSFRVERSDEAEGSLHFDVAVAVTEQRV